MLDIGAKSIRAFLWTSLSFLHEEILEIKMQCLFVLRSILTLRKLCQKTLNLVMFKIDAVRVSCVHSDSIQSHATYIVLNSSYLSSSVKQAILLM